MNLAKNFTLDELTRTGTDLPNLPSPSDAYNLLMLSTYILQPARDYCGRLYVNSGFRSFEVNRAIGGSPTSQHPKGQAADIKPLDADINEVFAWMKDNLQYGQLILETRGSSQWIHVSLPRLDKENQMAMIAEWNERFKQYDYTRVH